MVLFGLSVKKDIWRIITLFIDEENEWFVEDGSCRGGWEYLYGVLGEERNLVSIIFVWDL